jgi:hypothetical protein
MIRHWPKWEMIRNLPKWMARLGLLGSARTALLACPLVRLLARFRTAVPCVVKELFWFVLFFVHIAKT